jgi:hypothetical protein
MRAIAGGVEGVTREKIRRREKTAEFLRVKWSNGKIACQAMGVGSLEIQVSGVAGDAMLQ